jgi:hypothetical protein
VETFIEVLGKTALALLLIAGGVALVGLRWAALRSRPKGSYEELYHSDGEPATRDDHLHARDSRSLPPGRAYGDNYREPHWLRLFVAAVAVGGVVLHFVPAALPDKNDLWLSQGRDMEPAAWVGAIVVFTLAAIVWLYVIKGETVPWASSSSRRRTMANVPRPRPAAQTEREGEKPRAKRKRKFRRQL